MDHSPWTITTTQTDHRRPPYLLRATEQQFRTEPAELEALTQIFAPISLEEINSVALLNRTDTKFVMMKAQLFQALAALQPDYRMLCIDGQRLHHYRTLYFDTPDFTLYHLHVNHRPSRYKVRSREYADSHESFLEVKHKTQKARTIKERIPTAQPVMALTSDAVDWLRQVYPFDSQALQPKLWNTFTRITLVNCRYGERVTLDVDLTFYTNEHVAQMDSFVIAELKTDASHQFSPFLAQMRAQRIRPMGFSKYCVGVSLLYDQVKKNTLKPKMLRLEKMMKGHTNND